MNRHSGNNSSLGTGSHLEKHFPTRENSENRRRSRNKCANYDSSAKWCRQLGIGCVGPSNPLCKEYHEPIPLCKKKTKPHIHVGQIVNDKKHGVGMILAVQGQICTVRFHINNIERKCELKQARKMLLK